MCEDELPLLQPVQLFSKEIMMVFDRIISEIKRYLIVLHAEFEFCFS